MHVYTYTHINNVAHAIDMQSHTACNTCRLTHIHTHSPTCSHDIHAFIHIDTLTHMD